MLNELEEIFSEVRKTLLQEREKLLEEVRNNPKGEMSYRFDLKAEEILIDYCKKRLDFPVRILSEERGHLTTKEGKAKYIIVVDPVDGSTNFKRGIEASGFSVAVLSAEKPLAVQNVEFGLVGNLFTGSVCKAGKGKGCYFNGKRMQTRKGIELEKAIICLDTDATQSEKNARYQRLMKTVAGIRRLGSSTLEATSVAIGASDAHVDVRDELTPENFMATYLLVREAGGVFTNGKGEELPEIESMTDKFNIVAAGNKELHEKILSLLDF